MPSARPTLISAVFPTSHAFVLFVATATLAACKPTETAAAKTAVDAAPRVKVQVAPVVQRPMPRTLKLAGTLTASEDSDVAAGIAGKVLATFVERGQYVKADAPLARLDARLAEAAASEADAQLSSSRVQRELAKSDCDRTQRMFDKGAISKSDYDRAQAACHAAEFSESALAARKVTTASNLHDTTIRAPFAGIVAERAVSPGEYVRADSKVATLLKVDPLRLELTVPEAFAPEVRDNMEVTFLTAAQEEAGETRPQKAVIRYVGPAVRRQSRDLVVEAVVENGDRKLRPGMFVIARVALGDTAVPAIPRAAVRVEGSLNHVFVLTGDALEERLVQLGDEREGFVAVPIGLKSGEKVVAQVTAELRDGARVQL